MYSFDAMTTSILDWAQHHAMYSSEVMTPSMHELSSLSLTARSCAQTSLKRLLSLAACYISRSTIWPSATCTPERVPCKALMCRFAKQQFPPSNNAMTCCLGIRHISKAMSVRRMSDAYHWHCDGGVTRGWAMACAG